MDRAQLADWLARYESAWRSPGPEALAGLFYHFEEWPFWPPGSLGAAAGGA